MSDNDRMDRIFEGLYEASGIDLPEEARTAQAACSAFIEKHRKKGGGKGRAKRR